MKKYVKAKELFFFSIRIVFALPIQHHVFFTQLLNFQITNVKKIVCQNTKVFICESYTLYKFKIVHTLNSS